MTDKPQHTPGPWHEMYKDRAYQIVVGGDHIEVATLWHHCVGSIEKEMEANARLIAAAPELLEALEVACSIIEDEYGRPESNDRISTEYKMIKDAIAKAKGQGE